MGSKVYFVVNPRSANGRTGRSWAELKSAVERSLGPVGFGLTSGPMHATALTARALEDGFDTLVAVGGDGTLNEVLNGFYRPTGDPVQPGALLGYVPSATGGDFARTLGLGGLTPAGLVQKLERRTVRLLDHGRAVFRGPNGTEQVRRFINEASVGFSAETVDAVNHTTKALGGKTSFYLGALRCLARLRNHALEVSADGQPFFSGPAFMLAISNGRYFGGSMMIAPHAEPDDGMLDVTLVMALSRWEVARNMGLIYKGAHLGLPKVRVTRAKQVTVRSADTVLIEMDGEQPGRLDATFEIVPGAVSFLV